MANDENVHLFIDHFRGRLRWLDSLAPGFESVTAKKLVLVSILDALAKVRYPANKPQSKRFTSFVGEFTDWKHWDRVSLPHLVRALTLVELQKEFSPMALWSKERLADWQTDLPAPSIYADRDPSLEEIRERWPKIDPDKDIVPRVKLTKLSHRNLFYSGRNTLVHEFRTSTPVLDDGEIAEPYYSYINATGDLSAQWILDYPVKFVKEITAAALSRLETWLLEEKCNPLAIYARSSFYLEDLNCVEIRRTV